MAAKRNPSEPLVPDFDRHYTIEELVARQGTGPVELDAIRAEFSDLWPDDESIDIFLAFLQETRRENPVIQ